MTVNKAVKKTEHESLEALRAQLVELHGKETGIVNAASGRPLTADETKQLDELAAKFEALEVEAKRIEAVVARGERLSTPQARLTKPADLEVRDGASITGGMPAGTTDGSFGFRNMGDWAISAFKGAKGGRIDDRIMNAPSSFGSEGVNSDGGFAVPPDFRTNILKAINGEESLLGRTDQQVTSSNQIVLPYDSVTPWDASSGVQVKTAAEGGTIATSKPALGVVTCKANKYVALVPLTDELLEDAPAMSAWLSRKVPEKFDFRLNNDIVNGSGVGELQGLLNAPAKITQAAVAAQGAGTVIAKNILQMWGRLYNGFRANAVWIINQDVEQQLQQLVMPGTNPSQPAYMPPGGFSQSPFATLLGRPILVTEACQALGTEGDIILTDLKQYLTVMKAGGVRQDVSIHLYFDSDHTAFRFVMRVGGQSYLPGLIARKNGSNTLSSVVTLNSTRT